MDYVIKDNITRESFYLTPDMSLEDFNKALFGDADDVPADVYAMAEEFFAKVWTWEDTFALECALGISAMIVIQTVFKE